MKLVLGLIVGIALMGAAARAGQDAGAHVALARAAAGDAYQNLFNFLCTVPTPRGGGAGDVGRRADGPPPGPPDRSTWYAEPVKVFDNLYFVGQSEYSAWAVTTTEGIILIDTRLTSDRRNGSTTSRARPVRTSSCRITRTGTVRRSTCRGWRRVRRGVRMTRSG